MERTLENVHVVIYSKKMLKEAIKRLNNHGQNIETDIMCDYEFHGNDLLIYHDGLFKVIQCLPTHPNHEVTLNDLCEMVIDQESNHKEFAIGKWYKNDGFKLIFTTSKRKNDLVKAYGFGAATGQWFDDDNSYSWHVGDLVEASHKEVEKSLIKEASNRFKKGQTLYDLHHFSNRLLNDFSSFCFSDGKLWSKSDFGNVCIFNNGEWATVIKDCKVEMGDYVITELKKQPSPGFSVYQVSIQNTLDVLNKSDSLYNVKVIDKETFQKLRKDALC